jgi:hypothetical protein
MTARRAQHTDLDRQPPHRRARASQTCRRPAFLYVEPLQLVEGLATWSSTGSSPELDRRQHVDIVHVIGTAVGYTAEARGTCIGSQNQDGRRSACATVLVCHRSDTFRHDANTTWSGSRLPFRYRLSRLCRSFRSKLPWFLSDHLRRSGDF